MDRPINHWIESHEDITSENEEIDKMLEYSKDCSEYQETARE